MNMFKDTLKNILTKGLLTIEEELARRRICLALDDRDVDNTRRLIAELTPYVGMFKIGPVLYTASYNQGINFINEINAIKRSTFIDLKLHDTPNTVYEASQELVVPGVYMFNVHVAGAKNMIKGGIKGEEMIKGALQGRDEGFHKLLMKLKEERQRQFSFFDTSNNYIPPKPMVIGVTELTSVTNEDLLSQGITIKYNDLVRKRTELAREWGLDGIVCPASQAGALEKEFGSDFLYVTPGIKWKGVYREGQQHVYTPDQAVRDCKNSILVIGGAITKHKTPEERKRVAYEIIQAMAKEL